MTTTTHTFNFTSGVTADTDLGNAASLIVRQVVGTHTLTLTGDGGGLVVVNEDAITGAPDALMDGQVMGSDANFVGQTVITLSLDGSKVFDLSELSFFDLNQEITQLRLTTEKGSLTVALTPAALPWEGAGTRIILPNDPILKGVTSVQLSDASMRPMLVELDDIVLSNITAPVPPQTPGAPDLAAGSDSGTSNADNVTNAASLAFSGTSAAGDSGSTVTVFIDANGDGDFDAGEASDTAMVGSGAWSVDGVSATGLNGTYNAYAFLTSSVGSLTSPLSTALQLTIDRSAPTTTFSNIALSSDTGASNTDRDTNVAAQTITATLSQALAAGDKVEGSLNGGSTWTDLTAMVSGTSLAWTGATLAAGGGIRLRVVDAAGNAGVNTAATYTLDQTAPATTVASASFSADSGSDFIVNSASQTLAGTLSANLAAGERVEVSLDNGATWSTATASVGASAWSLAGITLAGSDTLQVRVADSAGNAGSALARAYVLDTAAPTASVPGSTQLLAPSGSSFTVTVSYADSGAGIDTATFGTGNIGVTGPLGASLSVTGFSASGSTVTYTVAAPGGSWDAGDAGAYTVAINAGSVRDAAGNAVAGNAAAGTVEVVFSTAPGVSALTLSADNGGSSADFITNVAAQTVGATLSRALAVGEVVEGSLDNGATWTDITAKVSGTTLAWDGVSLAAAGTLVVRVVDGNGLAGTPASHAYTVDTAAPAQAVASAALSADSGSVGDFITNVAAQTLAGTLDAPLAAGDFVEVSLDNGASWTTATAGGSSWSLGGLTLSGAGMLQVRVADIAGNQGAAWTQAYQLDTAAPTAATPVRTNMVDPAGASFTFTVSYADGGAGIDAATIGAGNVSVTGPGGALSVLGASASGNTVTYTVAAPGASWDPLDAGSYTIGINAQVKDLAGNTVAANASAHGFTVGVNSAPVLGGVFATPSIADTATATPFAGVTVSDLDGDAITLTIAYTAANGTLTGTGLTGSAGNYTLSGSAPDVQAALRALVFTPTANQSSGPAITTAFTLSAGDGKTNSTNGATVVTTAPVAPTATIALSDTDLKAGESATLTISFSEEVSGLSAADLTLPDASIGALSSSDGGRTWTATLSPTAGIASDSGQVQLDLAGVIDAGGLAGSGSATGPHYTLATVRPTATLAVSDASLGIGSTAKLTISFSEAVSGFSLADLALDMGSLSGLASSDGGITWTATLTPQDGAQGSALTVRLNSAGVQNAAGNTGSGIVHSNPYAVDTIPAAPPGVLIDGVEVTSERYIDFASGLEVNAIGVPVVTAGRTDDPSSPNAPLADIPLRATGGGAASILTVALPVGAGLEANGPTGLLTNGQALLDLIRRIEHNSAEGSGARQEMTGEGRDFLQALAGSTMLQTATVTPVAASGTNDVLISGSASGTANGAAGLAIGLVIDARQLAAGTTLQLNNVDFAAVVGSATLRGGAGNNTVVGDGASQNMFLGEGDDRLFGGGGADVIGSAGGADLLDGGSGNDMLAGGIGNDQLAGGAGNDVLQGGASSCGEWQFTLAASGTLGALHQTAVFAPGATETLALAALDRTATELAFLSAPRTALEEMALLYQAAFDRAPDIGGLNFYLSHGVSAAAVARAIAGSAEWTLDGTHALSDAAFVGQLYRNVLDRDGDSAGTAFWTAKLAGPAALSRAELLMAFALAPEHRSLQGQELVIAAASVGVENGWIAGSGDDRLEGGAGSDLLVGGDGIDTVVYAGKLADYRILLGADGTVQVADKANADVDTLHGIERGVFADGSVDLAFTQAGAATLQTVGLLYQGLLDRAGDLAGVAWWAGTGMDGAGLVSGFAASAEFSARYGAMSDTGFVAALYANAGLGVTAAGGSAAWVAMLQDHSRAELIGNWIAQDAVRDALGSAQGLWLI